MKQQQIPVPHGEGQLLGATNPQTVPAAFSTAPAHQRLGSANAETTPAGAPAAAADRTQRPDATCEGKTGSVQGPVKEQQPDGLSHRGSQFSAGPPTPAAGVCTFLLLLTGPLACALPVSVTSSASLRHDLVPPICDPPFQNVNAPLVTLQPPLVTFQPPSVTLQPPGGHWWTPVAFCSISLLGPALTPPPPPRVPLGVHRHSPKRTKADFSRGLFLHPPRLRSLYHRVLTLNPPRHFL